jgi:pilus assembly protein CpaB
VANNKKSITLLAIAVGLGIFGALLAMLYLNAREAELRERLKPSSLPIAVVVASKDLVKGDVLDGTTLSIRQIPSDFVSLQAIRPNQFDAISGKILQQNLASGKQLLKSFIGDEYPLDFSDTIEQKRRAMTIQVDEINSFSGLLRPGNRIDLLVNMASSQSGSKQVSPVLENVEVLSTGRQTAKDYEEKVRMLRGGVGVRPEQNYTNVTINVTPKEGALLAIAQDKGDIIALLRNRKDDSGSGFAQINDDNITENALALAQQSALREANATISNNIVASYDDKLAKSITVGADGVLRNANGVALANQDLVLGADGSIKTKNGLDLSGTGLTINDKGELVTADGKVVDPDDLKLNADGQLVMSDGTVLERKKVLKTADGVVLANQDLVIDANGNIRTKDGIDLSGRGLSINAKGELVTADGKVVDPNSLKVTSDGVLITGDGVILDGAKVSKVKGLTQRADGTIVAADGTEISGATLNTDGQLVLADGTVVNPDDITIGADGSIIGKDGQALAGVTAIKTLGTLTENADGSVTTADGSVISGATLNDKGQLVLEDGTVVDPNDVKVLADGSIVSRSTGEAIAGLMAKSSDTSTGFRFVDYIVGGSGKDGVALVNQVPVSETQQK